jgi:hypothetical protein
MMAEIQNMRCLLLQLISKRTNCCTSPKNQRMKKIILFCIILFNTLVAIGQTEKQKLEQLKAQRETIQKRADSMNNTLKNGTVKEAGKRPQVNAVVTTITNLELPKPDTLKIYALPKKILSLPELANYIKNLHDQLEKKLPPAMVSSAKAIAAGQ